MKGMIVPKPAAIFHRNRPIAPPDPVKPNPVTGSMTFTSGSVGWGNYDRWVVGYTRQGACDYHLTWPAKKGHSGHKTLAVAPHDMLLIPPRVSQRWQVPVRSPSWSILWAVFQPRPHWFAWLTPTATSEGYYLLTMTDPKVRHEAWQAMERMHMLATSSLRHRLELSLNALEQVLLWCQDEQSRQSSPMDQRVAAALEYMASHLHEPLTLQKLAASCHTSRSRLAALFSDQVGVAPLRYFEQQRMAKAAQLLEMTPLQVKQVAYELGYEDAHHFSKRFIAHFQQSPLTYRQQKTRLPQQP